MAKSELRPALKGDQIHPSRYEQVTHGLLQQVPSSRVESWPLVLLMEACLPRPSPTSQVPATSLLTTFLMISSFPSCLWTLSRW